MKIQGLSLELLAGLEPATYTHTTTVAQHQAAAVMGSAVSTGI